ncbi:CCR4-NOT transcription complex subunit 7-like [Paramacrobiotus metropolitanus]|uniref:CCR4-NOT transcription complex subunit 7-like n=1 Tax=Paramacrobiotus metropolitanus TaxID=2943436 RepID=UPI002445BD2E|nr:CCR4-NOT transcription complex subunit 7-like [Paramacrobiotus metropolitanus]
MSPPGTTAWPVRWRCICSRTARISRGISMLSGCRMRGWPCRAPSRPMPWATDRMPRRIRAARTATRVTRQPPAVAASGSSTESYGIKEVFSYNLEEEMRKINKLMKKYPYVAIDTEFPGVVARPCGVFNTNSDYEYALFKVNVDLMKIIQLGLSFFNEAGQQPTPIHTWQFNFRFNLAEEMYAQDSIKLLMHSGIQFSLHEQMGIEPDHFAERLITSNILCNDHVRFLTFHSAYDFGYLLKVLEGTDCLPRNESSFLEKLKMYFPHIYDIKHMIRDQRSLKGGLQDLANQFQLARVGAQHQAGSDSALTGALFFRLKDEVFHGKLDEFSGRLFGLTGNFGDRVHHLENVVIKENIGKPGAATASPVTGILQALSAVHEERQAEAEAAAKSHGSSGLTVSTSSAGGPYHHSHSAPILNHNNHPVNTFTFLTNVNVPHRFYEDPAGYMVTTTTSTGEYVVSNDPSVIHQQHQHAQYGHAQGGYYDATNGYV